MLLKNSEYPLKVKFSDEAFQNVFIGVAGDNQSRVLEVTILDLDNNIYKEDIPSFKILAKGDLDKKVYYNVGTKKTTGVYTVEIPSQVFKQSQNVEIQFLIENEETHERIFSPMIKQRVQRGFCANFEEGTNIYLDYEEILKFEENFDDFLNSISQDKDAILLEMIKVKDENKAEILLLKGDFEEASKQAVVAANKAKEEAIAAADTVKEEIGTASEQAVAEIKKELGVIKTETVEEMNSIKLSTIADVTEKGNQINASLTENKELILTAIAEKETSTINLITSEKTQSIANIKEASNTSLAEIKKQSEAELKVIKDTRDISVASLESKKATCIQEIETATSEAVNTIEDKIAELDTERIMQRLNELETLVAGFDDRIKANADTITGHSEEIKIINDSVLVHQTDIDAVTGDLNKKI